ncbi:co-chaperone DjlA [Catenovulum maritimum]|uniref:Co-chaperone protein DjlA n=1 Tax=Catenovulum maritimum TaxID=1513271 RepID=A0A0J8GZU2_9ALTE|nr:co-chaperone DjlA [Catenovulum maritimum]KMT66268.1 molecular chaperone DnaJ [Catenovulum maritimum]
MNSWGKILGLIFGFMFFRWPGAIMGVLIGHYFDKAYAKALADSGGLSSLIKGQAPLASRAIFFHTLFSIMGHIAKSSGRVTESDIALATAFMDKMGLKGDIRKEAQAAYREGKQTDFPIKETLEEFKLYCFSRRDFMLVYLEIQTQAAYANGQLHPNAKAVLKKVAKELGIDDSTFNALLSQVAASVKHHQQNQSANSKVDINNAYNILGVKPTDDVKTIKKAYKRLMAQHHPDKLSAQGLPEQAIDLAKEKAQDIQAAYEAISTSKK